MAIVDNSFDSWYNVVIIFWL